jgi:hypothetical protein
LGIFHDLVNEYLDGFATLHYADTQSARTALGPLFLFLNEKGIKSLDEVGPKVITDYLAWTVQAAQAFGQEDDITVLSLQFSPAGVIHA